MSETRTSLPPCLTSGRQLPVSYVHWDTSTTQSLSLTHRCAVVRTLLNLIRPPSIRYMHHPDTYLYVQLLSTYSLSFSSTFVSVYKSVWRCPCPLLPRVVIKEHAATGAKLNSTVVPSSLNFRTVDVLTTLPTISPFSILYKHQVTTYTEVEENANYEFATILQLFY